MHTLDLAALRFDGMIAREWLIANRNGGYASSTISGTNCRKYHGLLVAAMTPPVRRMVVLSRVEETIRSGDQSFDLAANEYPGVVHPKGHQCLRAFNPDPYPRWAYQSNGWTIEKQLRPLKDQNAVVLSYALLGSGSVEMELRPLFALRGMHELMYQWNGTPETEELSKQHHRIRATSRTPEAFFAHDGQFRPQPCWYLNTIYRCEQERGYAGLEDLWMPGVIRWSMAPGQVVHFVCSTEPVDLQRAIGDAARQYEAAPAAALPQRDPTLESLRRAADQFVVFSKDGQPFIMGAYPWASPSGRDAMISLPGLLLVPGRLDEAKAMLRHIAGTARNGLMPAEFAEDGSGYRYTAADTSLWFINAVAQYLRYRGDEAFVAAEMLPVILQIIEAYRNGTELGIRADADGLLETHAPGTPTTWMDAKVGDWVITPRAGRPSSLNALWHNALCIAADLCRRFGQPERDGELLAMAAGMKEAFNRRFWNETEDCLFDAVDDHGNDPSVRPDQILAISLPYPVLEIPRHMAVLHKVSGELLTPFGLRTLSPRDPSYQGHYGGPVVSRDRAYHQGSAFPWLLGPMVTAYLRVNGRGQQARREALKMLKACFEYLEDPGMGQICELFDGDPPYRPGGAMASARSVAEILRCYVEDVLDLAPGAMGGGAGRPVELENSPDRVIVTHRSSASQS